jgi:hypothetical protein
MLRVVREYISSDLLKILVLALPDYYKLLKSEEIAREELSYYDKEYNDKLADRKEPYEELIKMAEGNGIKVPNKAYDYEVTTADVLARLDEQMMIEIEEIEDTASKVLSRSYDERIVDDTYMAIDCITDEYERIKDNYIAKKTKHTLKRTLQD